jgi:hypothetical protein
VSFNLFLFFPIISSVEININPEYDKGETILAEIYGNFVTPLSSSNIYFYRKHLRTSFDYSIGKIGENYYLYAQTSDKIPGDYSIVISNAKYINDGKISSEEISKNFTIKNTSADFSISPGFIVSSEDFYIDVKNLKEETIKVRINTKTIYGISSGNLVFSTSLQDISSSFEVSPLSKKRINIKVSQLSGTSIRKISFSTGNLEYVIIAYLILQILFQKYRRL